MGGVYSLKKIQKSPSPAVASTAVCCSVIIQINKTPPAMKVTQHNCPNCPKKNKMKTVSYSSVPQDMTLC